MPAMIRLPRDTGARAVSVFGAGAVASALLFGWLSDRYDRRTGRVMMELTSGFVFGFPARAIPALAKASDDQLSAVELSPGGSGLHWNDLDVDLSIPGLLLSSVGRSEKLSEMARLAGRSRSRAKAKAARANGAKGGRPRKVAGR